MHRQILYFSVWPGRRKEFTKRVQSFENKYDFQILNEGVFSHALDLLLFLEEEKVHNVLRRLYVVVDYLPFFSDGYNYEKEASAVSRAIIGFPEVYFLFDETESKKIDFTSFLFKSKSQVEKLAKQYHFFNKDKLDMGLFALANQRTNLFDGTNLRYCLKAALYDNLEAHHNFKRIQTSRRDNLAICVEEERTQNRFESFALYANGFRVWPIMSAHELMDFNSKYQKETSDLKIIVRDFDLQFPDAGEDAHKDLTIKDKKEDENLVDYIRGAKYLENEKKWRALETNKNNHFWYNLNENPRLFISKGVDNIKIITSEEKLRECREQQRQKLEAQHTTAITAKNQKIANSQAEQNALNKPSSDSTSQVVQTEKEDAFFEDSKAVTKACDVRSLFEDKASLQYLHGMHKPVTGIYCSFQNIEIIKNRYDEDVRWDKEKKRIEKIEKQIEKIQVESEDAKTKQELIEQTKEYYIQTSRKEHHHGVPLDIYDLIKGMIDRARSYQHKGKFVFSAMVAQEALEILNGFHESLMLKAYHIYAVSENAVCMNLLGGDEHLLKHDARFRINKIQDDLDHLLPKTKKNENRKDLVINILNQIFSDCRQFCKKKEHFSAESVFIGAMGYQNEGYDCSDIINGFIKFGKKLYNTYISFREIIRKYKRLKEEATHEEE